MRKERSCNSFRTKIVSIVNCSNLYYVGLRKFNIVCAQLCMNCSNFNAHLHSLHIIDSPACICSHKVEDSAHFCLDCSLYHLQRLAIQNIVLRFIQFRLEMLLYDNDNLDYEDDAAIVLVVHEFPKDSDCASYVILLYIIITS